MKKLKILLLLFILAIQIQAQIIPDSLRVNWSAAGYQGEIPEPDIIVEVTDFGAIGDSLTDNYQAISDAINSLQENLGVIFFPSGDFIINSPLSLPDSIILRGSTSDSTNLIFDLSNQPINCINISKGQSADFTNIISGFNKGSLQLVVENASQFETGDFAEIRQENGDWDISPATWAENAVGQIVKITDVVGNTIYIEQPLRINFNQSLNPEIRKTEMRYNVGIECLQITRFDEPEEGAGSNIYFGFAAQCWIKGVESNKSVGSHIGIYQSTMIEVSGNYIHHAFTYDGAGTRGYGVTLSHHSGECLIENNIFKHLRHAQMIKVGANGNVFGYNYSIEPYRSEPVHDLSGDISFHGHFAFSNLFEGNIIQNIIIDHYWGPSGPYNTLFRNRAELYGILMTQNSYYETKKQNFVGNETTDSNPFFGQYLLTGSEHFQYGNNILGTIIPEGTNELNDTSYYLDAIPWFWNIDDEWPSIGIPNNLNSGSIPAYERYYSGYSLTVCNDSSLYTRTFEIEKNKTPEIKIWPNPCQNILNLEIPSETTTYCNLQLYDLLNQLIFEKEIPATSGGNTISIKLPVEIKSGLYLMRIRINDKFIVKKLIIEK
ncbi:MAG: T9SS type A sorting domain-containing protein [Bacteroidales bacterium]|nr:T9SS type A sorting domain-containing protein [Bacteroidales bacterium]